MNTKTRIRRYLLITTSVMLLPTLLLVGMIASTLAFRPELFVNTDTIRWTLNHLQVLPPDVRPEFLSVKINSITVFQKKLILNTSPFCLDATSLALKICTTSIKLEASIDLKTFPNVLKSIESLKITGLTAVAIPGTPTSQASVLSKSTFLGANEFLNRINQYSFRLKTLEIEDFSYEDMSGHLLCKQPSVASTFGCQFLLSQNFDLSGTFEVSKNQTDIWSFASVGRWTTADLKTSFKIDGALSEQGLISNLSGNLKSTNPEIPSLTISSCKFVFEHESGKGDCTFLAETPLGLIPNSPTTHIFPMALKLDFGVSQDKLKLSTKLTLLSNHSFSFSLAGNFWTRFEGKESDLMQLSQHEIGCNFFSKQIPFQEIVPILNSFGVFVPAPLHSLKGPTDVALSCQNHLNDGIIRFPVSISSKLRSQNQNLSAKIDSVIDLSINTVDQTLDAVKISSDLKIREAQFVLPKLDIRSIPVIFKSSAFQKSNQAQSDTGTKSVKISWAINVSADDKPISVLSNLTTSPLEFNGHASLSSEHDLSGNIKLMPVSLELFHKKATIEFFTLRTSPDSDSPYISSRILVLDPDYKIYATLAGTLATPILAISSDPPLPTDEIFSVLLYGSPAEQISLDERSSTQSLQSVFLGRSVSLFSLYILASTPVQKIDLNTESKEISATVKASDKLTIRLGAAAKARGQAGIIGVRRKLGNSFSVITEVETTGEQSTSSASAWLEWSKRY